MILSVSSNLAFCLPRQLHPMRESSHRLGTSTCVLGGKYNCQHQHCQWRGHITLGQVLNISVAQFCTSVKWDRDAGNGHHT